MSDLSVSICELESDGAGEQGTDGLIVRVEG